MNKPDVSSSTAWVCAWQVSGISPENEILERLDEAKWVISDCLNEMSIDGVSFALQLVNGNILYFTNSEWGSISKITEKDYYEA